MAATLNTIPTLNGALWNGNQQLATKRDLINLSTQNITNASTINTSNLIAVSVSSIFGDFSVNLVSTLQFNPSLGGVNVDLNMGGFLGGLLGGVGSGIFNTALGGAALGTGIAALTMSRPGNSISPNINSNVFETINGTAQLQVSTLGSPTWTIQRVVSSISPNQVPGREVFISTLIPAGATAIRTFSDPINLANPSTLTSSIQAYGQWASLEESPVFTASNIVLNYTSSPAIGAYTEVVSSFNWATPYAGITSNFSTVSQPWRTAQTYLTSNIYPSTSFNPPLVQIPGSASNLGTPYVLNDILTPSITRFKAPAGSPGTYINATVVGEGTYDIDNTGAGPMGFWLPKPGGYNPPAPADLTVPPNVIRRVYWNYNFGNTSTLVFPIPNPVSTIITTSNFNDSGLYQTPNLSYFSTNKAWAFGGNVTMSNDLTVGGNLNANLQNIRANSIIASTITAASNITGLGLIQGNQVSAVVDVAAPALYGTLVSGSNVNATSLLTAPSTNTILLSTNRLFASNANVTGIMSTGTLVCNNFQVTGPVAFNQIAVTDLLLTGINFQPSISFLAQDESLLGDYSVTLPLGNNYFRKTAVIAYVSWLVGSGDVNNPTIGNFQWSALDGLPTPNTLQTASTINFYVPQSGGDAFTSGSFQVPLFQNTHYTSTTTTLQFTIKHINGRNNFFNRGGNNISFFAIL